MNNTYSPEQLAYIGAKAKMSAIMNSDEYREVLDIEKAAFDHLDMGDVDAYKTRVKEYRELMTKLGYLPALADLRRAEEVLIAWAHEQVKQQPGYKENEKELVKLFTQYHSYPEIREKLINASIGLAI